MNVKDINHLIVGSFMKDLARGFFYRWHSTGHDNNNNNNNFILPKAEYYSYFTSC